MHTPQNMQELAVAGENFSIQSLVTTQRATGTHYHFTGFITPMEWASGSIGGRAAAGRH